LSTFLGTLPIAFIFCQIFITIFYCSLELVVFGISHALIGLPVVLSILGPEEQFVLRVQAPRNVKIPDSDKKVLHETVEI
jgi:hypothetical protein